MNNNNFEEIVVKHYKPIFLNYLKEYKNNNKNFNYVLSGAGALELQVQNVLDVNTKDADMHIWSTTFQREQYPYNKYYDSSQDDNYTYQRNNSYQRNLKKQERIDECDNLKRYLIKAFDTYKRYNPRLINYFTYISKNKNYLHIEKRRFAPSVTFEVKIFGIDIADITHKWHSPTDYVVIPDKFPMLTVKTFLIDQLKIFYDYDKVSEKKTLINTHGKTEIFEGVYSDYFKTHILNVPNQTSLNVLFISFHTTFYQFCRNITKTLCIENIIKDIISQVFLTTPDYRITRITKALKRLFVLFSDFVITTNNLNALSIYNFEIQFKTNFSSCLLLSLHNSGNILVNYTDTQYCEDQVVIGNSNAPNPPDNLNLRKSGITRSDFADNNYCMKYAKNINLLPPKYLDTDYMCHWTMSSKKISNQCMNFYYSALFDNMYDIKPYKDGNKHIYTLINNMQRIIYSVELQENITVYRSSRSTIYNENTSTYNLKINKSYFQPVFCSTTIYKGAKFLIDFSNFETGLAAFIINIPRGSNVVYLKNCSSYKSEYEVLLPLGCRLKITKIDDEKYVKGANNMYFKMRIYYADYVKPAEELFDISKGEINFQFIHNYIRSGFLKTKNIELHQPKHFIKKTNPQVNPQLNPSDPNPQLNPLVPNPSDPNPLDPNPLDPCSDMGDYFAKVFELVNITIENAKNMLQNKLFTFENLKQLITWFQTIFKNLIDMFYYIAPIVWKLFNQIVINFKDFVIVSSIGVLKLAKVVIITLFNGVEYILNLSITSDSNKSYFSKESNLFKKLKV